MTLAVSSWHKVYQHTMYRNTCQASPRLGPRLGGLRQWLSQGYLLSHKALPLPINLAPPEFLLGKEIQGYSSSLYHLMLLRVAQRLDLNRDKGVQWEADVSAGIWSFCAQKHNWRGCVYHSDLAWMPSIEPLTPTPETTLLGTGPEASIGWKSTFLSFPHWWHKPMDLPQALCPDYSIVSYSLWFSCLEWPEAEYLPNVIWMCQVFQYMLLNLMWKPPGPWPSRTETPLMGSEQSPPNYSILASTKAKRQKSCSLLTFFSVMEQAPDPGKLQFLS